MVVSLSFMMRSGWWTPKIDRAVVVLIFLFQGLGLPFLSFGLFLLGYGVAPGYFQASLFHALFFEFFVFLFLSEFPSFIFTLDGL